MEKKRGRLIEIVGTVAAAAVVVLFLWIALNQPVPASTQSPSSPTASPSPTTGTPPADQTSVPPASPPNGGQTPPGGDTGSNGTTPAPPALGNGHKVPNGWTNAACPDNGKGKGVQARCGSSATYGALQKAGLAGSLIVDPNTFGKTRAGSAGSQGALHASANGNSVASGTNPGRHNGNR